MLMSISDRFKKLKGFEQHGVRFTGDNESQAIGVCPFCGKGKFYANLESLLWDCKSCGINGNFTGFLDQTVKRYSDNLLGSQLSAIAVGRGLHPQTLKAWGIGWAGSFYAIPVNGNPGRRTTDIRRYNPGSKSMATAGGKMSFISPIDNPDSDRVWITEGEWDGAALWEVLTALDIHESIYASPGAAVFPVELMSMFYNKNVIVCYDNDDSGFKGAQRIHNKIGSLVKSIKYIHWPAGLPSGFDLRDYYHSLRKDVKEVYAGIMGFLKDSPPVDEATQLNKTEAKSQEVLTGTGMQHEAVYKGYKKWLLMKSTEALDILYGAIFANRLDGDPLWIFLVAPPGGMKTELLMSVSNAPKIYTTTSLTPHALISGANFAGGGDPSLIPKLNNKVLIIKDFTTILSLNSLAREEIFGVLRDIYDGRTEKQFGNGIVRRYESRFGIIAGVTPIIETVNISNMSLGERFIKYKIKQVDNSGRESIKQALLNLKQNSLMRQQLLEIGTAALDREVDFIPDLGDEIMERIVSLAQFIARLRGVVSRERYTGTVNFKPMSEIGTRIAKQLCKLAMGIAIFKGDHDISEATYDTIVNVGKDTIPDRVEEIVKQLFIHERPGESNSTQDISRWSKFPLDTTRFMLQDLSLLEIVARDSMRQGQWRIAPGVLRLMQELKLYGLECDWQKQIKSNVRRLR